MSDINEKKELGTGGATTPEQASDIELGAAKVSWFRGTMMQAIIVGVASFLAPVGVFFACGRRSSALRCNSHRTRQLN